MSEGIDASRDGEKYELSVRLRLDDILKEGDLPKIVVDEESIVILDDNDWVEKNEPDVVDDEEYEVDKELAIRGIDDRVLTEILEEIVGGDESGVRNQVSGAGKVGDYVSEEKKVGLSVGELYDSGGEEYVAGAGEYEVVEVRESVIDVGVAEETLEEVRRGGRSTLEIAGFRDKEAEKRRKDRKDWLR